VGVGCVAFLLDAICGRGAGLTPLEMRLVLIGWSSPALASMHWTWRHGSSTL